MKKMGCRVVLAALALGVAFFGCDLGGGDGGDGGPLPNPSVGVTGLANVPDTAYAGAVTDLLGVTVVPANADRQTIVWTVKNVGGTGVTDADLADLKFTPTGAGTLALTATVVGGRADGSDFTEERTITVYATDDRPDLVGTVSITTTAIRGMTLVAVNPAGTLTSRQGVPIYHWQRGATNSNTDSDWADITGAYGLSYTLGNDDVGKYIRLVVSYSRSKGSVVSNVAGPVKASLPAVLKPEPIDVSDAAAWNALLDQIEEATDAYVALDLSACTMTGNTEFDPGTGTTGVGKIMSLVLPDAATSIKAETDYNNATFKNFTALTSVNGKGIQSVGDCAFARCAALTQVDFPKVETIGGYAFTWCVALSTADFPKAVSIGEYAFVRCDTLTTVNFPAAQNIGDNAFFGCDALTEASFPVATSIGVDAFSYSDALKTVNLPKATDIGGGAFTYCAALKTVNLPKAETIGSDTFSGCAALETLSFPATLTAIGDYSFAGCVNLTTIEVAAANPAYQGRGGMLLNKAGNTLFAYPSASGAVTLEAAITTIDIGAFRGCTALTTVNLPAATAIREGAFWDCAALTTVNAPAVTTIDRIVFLRCEALTTVSLPEATGISGSAFQDCTALATVSLPKATAIDDYAFQGCAALTPVNLPAAASIRFGVFWNTGTTALTVTLGSTAPTLGYMMFNGVTSTKTVTVRVPSGATGYGSSPANTTDVNWGNGFRGGGWDGTGFVTNGASYVNSNINLTIEYGP
jgi:hypothetical protein